MLSRRSPGVGGGGRCEALHVCRTFEKYQIAYAYLALESIMPTLIFRCPSTGMNVQAWFADDAPVDNGETYELADLSCLCPSSSREPGDRENARR